MSQKFICDGDTDLEPDILEQGQESSKLRGSKRRVHDLPMSVVNFPGYNGIMGQVKSRY